jgi:hypothetical protein
MGLDIENKKNEAACSYQKKIWEELIKYLVENESLQKLNLKSVISGK